MPLTRTGDVTAGIAATTTPPAHAHFQGPARPNLRTICSANRPGVLAVTAIGELLVLLMLPLLLLLLLLLQ